MRSAIAVAYLCAVPVFAAPAYQGAQSFEDWVEDFFDDYRPRPRTRPYGSKGYSPAVTTDKGCSNRASGNGLWGMPSFGSYFTADCTKNAGSSASGSRAKKPTPEAQAAPKPASWWESWSQKAPAAAPPAAEAAPVAEAAEAVEAAPIPEPASEAVPKAPVPLAEATAALPMAAVPSEASATIPEAAEPKPAANPKPKSSSKPKSSKPKSSNKPKASPKPPKPAAEPQATPEPKVIPAPKASPTPKAAPVPSPETEPLRSTAVWQPKVASQFQIVLSGSVDTSTKLAPDNVHIWDIDLFNTPVATIRSLKQQNKKVICYFSAGTSEDWREDFRQFNTRDMGQKVAKDDSGKTFWTGEKWLNIKNPNPSSPDLPNVWKIMRQRIKIAADKGCDAIDPDNMDGYDNKSGLQLTEQDSVNFMKFMADEARKYNMSIGLKNSISILPKVSKFVQFAVNEECAAMKECNGYKSFLMSKPVFHIEYVQSKGKPVQSAKGLNMEAAEAGVSKYCTPSNAPDLGPKFSTVIKLEDLDGWVRFCDGREATTRVVKDGGKGRGRSRVIESEEASAEEATSEEATSEEAGSEEYSQE